MNRIPTRQRLTGLRLVATVIAMATLGVASPLLGIAPAAAQGFGYSPTVFDFQDALRGGTTSQTLTLLNSTASEARVTVTATGEAGSWVTFSRTDDAQHAPTTNFTIPAQSRLLISVSVTVPPTAGNRKYQSTVQVSQVDDPTRIVGGSGANVGVGAVIDMAVNVTGAERRAATVTDIYVDGAEVGQAQRFNARISNTGNVNVQPQLDVKIKRGATDVASISSKGQNFTIAPGRDEIAYVDWNTTDTLPGSYTASITVTDVGASPAKALVTKDVDFRLDPPGATTRSGLLNDLKLLNNPGKGDVAQFAATFYNTGKIDSKAVFEGELYRGNKLVKSVVTPERVIRQGSSATVNFNVDMSGGGKYRLVGKANFEGVLTDTRELKFEIGGSGGAGNTKLYAIGAVLLVIVVIAALLIIRRRRGPDPRPEATVAQLEARRQRLSA